MCCALSVHMDSILIVRKAGYGAIKCAGICLSMGTAIMA